VKILLYLWENISAEAEPDVVPCVNNMAATGLE